MLRKNDAAGREAPLRPAGGLGGRCKPQAGLGAAPQKILKILQIWRIKSSISAMFFIIINPFSKQAATTEKEKKSDAQIVFTTDRKRNSSGFFSVPSKESS